jgi:UDP-glucose 4-epimerase
LGAILVTGGAGYVGAHACKALRRAGYPPVVFDNFSTGHKSFVRWGPLVPGDIRDPARYRPDHRSCCLLVRVPAEMICWTLLS